MESIEQQLLRNEGNLMSGFDYQAPWDDYREVEFEAPRSRKTKKFEAPQKSALITVELAEDRLPRNLILRRNWKDYFTPGEYGTSIMEAYRYALYERSSQMIERGATGRPSTPALRDIVPTLLQTREYSEYQHLLDRLVGNEIIEVHGPGVSDFDEPTLTVRSNRSMITKISFDYDWALRADISTIAHDLVYCANQIRAARPSLVTDNSLAHETDSELAERLAAHISRIRQE
ncbi:hypothetical protein NLM24_25615 [Nocardia zapadnayensis]|uniref:hypothetical protein n=1 Tax=Nocardia rhamnosiphila TaxID=426716 RepID=UPI0022481958|nr:hypothetical protein [Nocardia zapadnayensis]MCX0274009.1 hypothetical protein [Nocardia zapadnayensis]